MSLKYPHTPNPKPETLTEDQAKREGEEELKEVHLYPESLHPNP